MCIQEIIELPGRFVIKEFPDIVGQLDLTYSNWLLMAQSKSRLLANFSYMKELKDQATCHSSMPFPDFVGRIYTIWILMKAWYNNSKILFYKPILTIDHFLDFIRLCRSHIHIFLSICIILIFNFSNNISQYIKTCEIKYVWRWYYMNIKDESIFMYSQKDE